MRGRDTVRTRSTSMTRRGLAADGVAARGGGGGVRTRHLADVCSGSNMRDGARARQLRQAPSQQHSSEGGRGGSSSSSLAAELQQLSDDYYGAPAVVAARAAVTRPPARMLAGGGGGNDEYVCASPYNGDGVVSARWRRGPSDTAGRRFDASDRNLLCMDVYTSEEASSRRLPSVALRGRGAVPSSSASRGSTLCVVGSADHGLRVFDVATLRAVTQLYGARCGHTEWVTACKFLPGARVLSGGMDSKLCLWSTVTRPGAARCVDLLGHTGSISQVEVSASGTRAMSASYDRTLRVWDCDAEGRSGGGGGGALACLAGHEAAVTAFAWSSSRREVVSADRRGGVRLWDVPTATCVATLQSSERVAASQAARGAVAGTGATSGQLGAVAHMLLDGGGGVVEDTDRSSSSSSSGGGGGGGGGQHVTLLGDQRGNLTVLDWRANSSSRDGGGASTAVVCAKAVHPGGVLSGIRAVQGAPHLVVTCGADRRVVLLDARRGFDVVHAFADHTDYVYALETHGPLVLSGGGNGWLLVHDTTTLECCYGLGASTDAVRAIHAQGDYLIAACDDGKAMVYDFAIM